jgi:hypothetical protein
MDILTSLDPELAKSILDAMGDTQPVGNVIYLEQSPVIVASSILEPGFLGEVTNVLENGKVVTVIHAVRDLPG